MRRAVLLLGAWLAALALVSPAAASTSVMPRDPARNNRWAWEPGMAAAADGTLYAAGNHCALVDQRGVCESDPNGPLFSPDYTPLWRSTDGGRSYSFLADPLALIEGKVGIGSLTNRLGQDHPGGYDTDVAVAPGARPGRPPIIYVVSAFEASSTLALSGDGGRSWRIAQLSGGLPVQDRPWLAAVGRCDLYLQYHPLTGAENVAAVARVERYDGCRLLDDAVAGLVVARPLTSTLVEPVANEVTVGNQVMGKLAATGGRVLVAYQQCDTFGATLDCNTPGTHQSVHVALSADRAASFSDVALPDADLHGPLNDSTWPMAMGADADRIAVAAVDTRHVALWISHDAGRTWQLRTRALDAPLGWSLASVPTVAVRGRTIAVAWYGSPPAGPGTPQRWYLTLARSDDAGASFRLVHLDPVLATTSNGSSIGAALYDDFGALVTRTGDLALAYNQLCDGHPPDDPECPGAPFGVQAHALVVRSAFLPPAATASGALLP